MKKQYNSDAYATHALIEKYTIITKVDEQKKLVIIIMMKKIKYLATHLT